MDKNNLIEQMNAYYQKRAPLHDKFMGYSTNVKMEELLAPIIRHFEEYMTGKDVLEIACGTGNWTQVLAKRARSVLATDIKKSVLEIARTKSYMGGKVIFKVADAYALETVNGKFNAAFAVDWWSHIPKSMISAFVKGLHRKLHTGARVIFIDMLPSESLDRMFSHYDKEGNLIHKRSLPDGQEFYVVKNFPAKIELMDVFDSIAEDIEFHEYSSLRRWMLSYRMK